MSAVLDEFVGLGGSEYCQSQFLGVFVEYMQVYSHWKILLVQVLHSSHVGNIMFLSVDTL
jgi:hypothetical protein